MTNVIVCGICGKMGGVVRSLVDEREDMRVVCGVDVAQKDGDVPVYASFDDIKESADVVIDFSSPKALRGELEWAKVTGCACVLASTGYSKEDLEYIEECKKSVPIFKTANFSLGVNLMTRLVKMCAETLGESFDVEIVERHHNQKADAPSGTALMLADSVNEAFEGKKEYICGRTGMGKRGGEIGIHSVRGGTIVGEHEVMFAGDDEVISITHTASSKKVFAQGAVAAAAFMMGKAPGGYDMNGLLSEIL